MGSAWAGSNLATSLYLRMRAQVTAARGRRDSGRRRGAMKWLAWREQGCAATLRAHLRARRHPATAQRRPPFVQPCSRFATL